MFNFFKNLLKKDNRLHKRKKAEYVVACKSLVLNHSESIIASDEIITKTECISQKGLSLKWPDNYKCHLCKHRIDVERSIICELNNKCSFDFSCFGIGSDIHVTLQVKGEIFENLKAKVVWHKEANKKVDFYGRMGISFYEPINFEF
jgi:hypothetical protein